MNKLVNATKDTTSLAEVIKQNKTVLTSASHEVTLSAPSHDTSEGKILLDTEWTVLV